MTTDLDKAVERLAVAVVRTRGPRGGWMAAAPEDVPKFWTKTEKLVLLSDAEATLSSANARAKAAEEGLREIEALADLSLASPGTIMDVFDQGARAARLEARDLARTTRTTMEKARD